MWLLRNTHKHIAQDTLSEYLDGRLQGRTLERVELQLSDCDACRQELDGLRATVALMQQLPMEAPRRSFVMSAPPPEPARARPMLALRAPNWVYAGAASVAALALAVTISVDATGGMKSDPLRQDAEVATLATSGGTAVESAARSGEAPGAAENESAPMSLAAAAPEAETADQPAEEAPAGGGAAGFSAEPATSTLAEAAPVAPPGPVTTGADGDTSSTTDSAAKTFAVEEPTEEPIEEPPPIPELAEGDLVDDVVISGTSVWWRVLEVAAGALAFLFLVALALRWKASRRNSV